MCVLMIVFRELIVNGRLFILEDCPLMEENLTSSLSVKHESLTN